jgi:ketosteroid isomerase-like protein
MVTEEDFWKSERRFWLEGEAHFLKMMAPGCIMVFPEPAGILAGEAITASLQSMPRWASVEMLDVALSRIGDQAVVLAYRAEARRGDDDPYRAFCTSTYAKTEDGWRLAQHQHTPIKSQGD